MVAREDEDFALDSDLEFPQRDDGREGPPDDWKRDYWFDFKGREFWYRWTEDGPWRRDPPKLQPLGHGDGVYQFVTAIGEPRAFTSSQLFGRGGMADLFGGDLRWATRHFPMTDKEGHPTGRPNAGLCMERMIQLCIAAGYLDGALRIRSIGTWRGPDGRPVVHAGDRIFSNGEIRAPGARLGEALYVIGGRREPPLNRALPLDGYEWVPADAAAGRTITSHLDEWAWDSPEDRDLFQGSLHCSMLCAALSWLSHVFVLAPYGSGKSHLLRYAKTVVGGAAHPVLNTYTKAYIEQHFTSTGMALFLDELESAEESTRIRRLFELIRALSDDGAEGGRGSAGGKTRKLDVHGTVTMAATTSEEWRPQDRSRITVLSLRPFASRGDSHPPAPPEYRAAQLARAAEMSAALRARALDRWDLFQANLKVAREAILRMGGAPRDGDQLGHLIAGWSTMTTDDPLDAGDHEALERFRPYIVSLAEADDGDDEPTVCLNTIFGLAPDKWIGGERVTVGQLVALARGDSGSGARRALLPYGLMLVRNEGEGWEQAWLAVANRHAGLDGLLAGYPQYQGKPRQQVLAELTLTTPPPSGSDGLPIVWKAVKGPDKARIGGSQTRYLLVPPVFLPPPVAEAT